MQLPFLSSIRRRRDRLRLTPKGIELLQRLARMECDCEAGSEHPVLGPHLLAHHFRPATVQRRPTTH